MITPKDELFFFSLASDLFEAARDLSSKYNAVIAAVKACENQTNIKADEFKEWLDRTLNAMNESWNAQYDAVQEGKSIEEVHKIGRDHAINTFKELFNDD